MILFSTMLKVFKQPHPWLFNQLLSFLTDQSMQIFPSLEDMKYAQGKIINHENAEKIIQVTAMKTILKLITSTRTFYNYLPFYDNEVLFFLILMTYMKNADLCMRYVADMVKLNSNSIHNRNIIIDGANEDGSQLNDVGELEWRPPRNMRSFMMLLCSSPCSMLILRMTLLYMKCKQQRYDARLVYGSSVEIQRYQTFKGIQSLKSRRLKKMTVCKTKIYQYRTSRTYCL